MGARKLRIFTGVEHSYWSRSCMSHKLAWYRLNYLDDLDGKRQTTFRQT